MIAATLLAVGTIVFLWLVAVPWGPIVCPAIEPAPLNCQQPHRADSATVATWVVLGIYALTMLFALVAPIRRRSVVVVGVTLLAICPIAAYVFVAWVG
ncbi:hypothetical protein ASF40_06400 [Microbacterium sp. Leaf288]|nr:hypothetical protein ASF40_06400 [Microbacterium sp. Leaf288]